MQSVQDAKRRNRKGRLFRGARGTPEPRQTKPSRPGLHPGQSSDGGVKGGLTPPPLPYLAGSTRLSLTKSQRVVKISAQFTHNAATIRAQGLDCPTRAVNGRILAPNHGSRLGQKDLDCRTWPWPAACRGGSGCPISGLRRRPVWQPGLSWPLAGVGPGAATAEHFAACTGGDCGFQPAALFLHGTSFLPGSSDLDLTMPAVCGGVLAQAQVRPSSPNLETA